ncbi:MAG: hypothetical protein HY849_04425 [Nitrosomonadales bacterium]|nr:hypothetical protein [Nitrosomonadales bacterium]
MGIEYIFFYEHFRDRFVQFISTRKIAHQLRWDEMGGFVAELPDGLDEAVTAELEAEYEALMEQEHDEQTATEEGWVTSDAMGVEIRLADGRPCIVRIPQPFIRRLSQHFSPEELHALVAAIAQGVENPVTGPICKTL